MKDRDYYGYGKPFEPVFTLNYWTLYKHLNGVALKHACQHHMGNRKMIVEEVFVYTSQATQCWRCTDVIPEEIVALSVLYNWDNNEKEARW